MGDVARKIFKPLLLIILDGFGVSLEKTANPIMEARHPTLDELEHYFPFATLQASGVAVGLPWGKAGNSEVGHLTIGAGKTIYHHLPRIINAVDDGSFFKNTALVNAAEHAKKFNSNLHIAGLLSSGSVHSYKEHLWALLELCKKTDVKNAYLHVFTDGRDSPPHKGIQLIKELEDLLARNYPGIKIASVIGRSYAMDRDENWTKTQKTYELLTSGAGEKVVSVEEYLTSSYQKGISDEFIEPAIVVNPKNKPLTLVGAGDALIFFNFREDSMRQITQAFSEAEFEKFTRKKVENLLIVTMTEYKRGMPTLVAFPSLEIKQPLAEIIGEAGLKHLHIAETEKYAHVSYFLNGGEEAPFPGEERILIPSQLDANFDQNPEMKAEEITNAVLENFDKYDVIIANFANADMVGHSGNFQASIKAVEILDGCLSKLGQRVLNSDGVMVITADHGNVELKRNILTGEKLTEHSLNPVPLFLVAKELRRKHARSPERLRKAKTETQGLLIDVAPTVLELLGLKKPPEMTGKSLVKVLCRAE